MTKFLITLLLGWSGIHKFIEGKIGLGIIYFLTFGLFGIGWFIDIIIAATKLKLKPNTTNIIKIDVAGEYYKKSEISSILSGNPYYNLPDNDFVQKIKPQKHIYRFKYRKADAILIPEPNNPYDLNAIKVLIDNVHIGYIPSERCIELKRILKKIKSITAHIHSGDYKYHTNGDVYKNEGNFSIELYITL